MSVLSLTLASYILSMTHNYAINDGGLGQKKKKTEYDYKQIEVTGKCT